MFEFIKKSYNVNPEIGLVVYFQNQKAVIAKDFGNYLGIIIDGEKKIKRIHPTWEVIYTDQYQKVPKQTRSQERYQKWLHSDSNLTFAEYIGCDKQTLDRENYMRLILLDSEKRQHKQT